jgi:NAD(P)-dependent dehydrogenase (short-subunit alcohol dehydrogenase family)
MAGRLAGKVAIVTGAGSVGPGWGNGKATAVLFAREGASVFAIDINRGAAEETQAIIADDGGTCSVYQADVSRADDVAALVAACLDTYGRIDILHNNVGITELGGAVEISEASWDRVLDVNAKSVFLTCKHVLPVMERQGGGAIVNVSSIASIRWLGTAYDSYAASKGAINALTQHMALQYARKGIRVNVILPGMMNTPLIAKAFGDRTPEEVERRLAERHAACPTGQMGDAWDVAYAALFLASDEARYITGQQLIVDGGLTGTCV